MLIRFLKHTPVEWTEHSESWWPSWYAPGDCAIATFQKQDSKGVWLILHSDDDMLCIVSPESFEILEDMVWNGPVPQLCDICSDVYVENHFFWANNKIMCIDCFNLLNYKLAIPFLEDSNVSRYELDKSQNQWIRTG